MKKLLTLLSITFLFTVSVFAQDINYNAMETTSTIKKYQSYTSKDGVVYKVGDTITIGYPSSNKTFAFIQTGDGFIMPIVLAPANSSGSKTTIKYIYVLGTNRTGKKAMICAKGTTGLFDQYLIDVENAVATKELKSNGISSDEALVELKKAKDKLDLGLITPEAYELKKQELIKYIK